MSDRVGMWTVYCNHIRLVVPHPSLSQAIYLFYGDAKWNCGGVAAMSSEESLGAHSEIVGHVYGFFVNRMSVAVTHQFSVPEYTAVGRLGRNEGYDVRYGKR